MSSPPARVLVKKIVRPSPVTFIVVSALTELSSTTGVGGPHGAVADARVDVKMSSSLIAVPTGGRREPQKISRRSFVRLGSSSPKPLDRPGISIGGFHAPNALSIGRTSLPASKTAA